MAGPWEEYAAPTAAASSAPGPWSEFQAPSTPPSETPNIDAFKNMGGGAVDALKELPGGMVQSLKDSLTFGPAIGAAKESLSPLWNPDPQALAKAKTAEDAGNHKEALVRRVLAHLPMGNDLADLGFGSREEADHAIGHLAANAIVMKYAPEAIEGAVTGVPGAAKNVSTFVKAPGGGQIASGAAKIAMVPAVAALAHEMGIPVEYITGPLMGLGIYGGKAAAKDIAEGIGSKMAAVRESNLPPSGLNTSTLPVKGVPTAAPAPPQLPIAPPPLPSQPPTAPPAPEATPFSLKTDLEATARQMGAKSFAELPPKLQDWVTDAVIKIRNPQSETPAATPPEPAPTPEATPAPVPAVGPSGPQAEAIPEGGPKVTSEAPDVSTGSSAYLAPTSTGTQVQPHVQNSLAVADKLAQHMYDAGIESTEAKKMGPQTRAMIAGPTAANVGKAKNYIPSDDTWGRTVARLQELESTGAANPAEGPLPSGEPINISPELADKLAKNPKAAAAAQALKEALMGAEEKAVPQYKVGDTVNLKDVGPITIKKMNADGTFEY